MKTRLLLFVLCLLCLVGCTDTPDSMARQYRNAINECMDALMFVTDESSANRMKIRVFKPMFDRFQGLDKKMTIFKNNLKKPAYVKEVFESDGIHLYLSELQINRQRFALERTRLRLIYQQRIERDRERFDNQGDEEKQFNPATASPALHGIIEGDTLDPLWRQLKEPALATDFDQFPSWGGGEKDYPKLFDPFKKKRDAGGAFAPKEVKLVY